MLGARGRRTRSVAQTIEEVLLAHGGVVRADIVGADVGRVMRHRQMMFHNLRKKRAYVFAVILYCTFGAYSICGQSLTRPRRLCAHHAQTHAHAGARKPCTRAHAHAHALAHARMRKPRTRTHALGVPPVALYSKHSCVAAAPVGPLRTCAALPAAPTKCPRVLGFSAASCISVPGQASPHRPTLRRRRTEEAEFPK